MVKKAAVTGNAVNAGSREHTPSKDLPHKLLSFGREPLDHAPDARKAFKHQADHLELSQEGQFPRRDKSRTIKHPKNFIAAEQMDVGARLIAEAVPRHLLDGQTLDQDVESEIKAAVFASLTGVRIAFSEGFTLEQAFAVLAVAQKHPWNAPSRPSRASVSKFFKENYGSVCAPALIPLSLIRHVDPPLHDGIRDSQVYAGTSIAGIHYDALSLHDGSAASVEEDSASRCLRHLSTLPDTEKILDVIRDREKWDSRQAYFEDPLSFIERVYPDRRTLGLVKADLRQGDPKLYRALFNWLNGPKDGQKRVLPADFGLPTKKQRNTELLAEVMSDPNEPARRRLYAVAAGRLARANLKK